MMRAIRLVSLAALILPRGAFAQAPVTVRSAVLFESYSFAPGIVLSKVSEFTVPIGADIKIGSRGRFAVSGGFANVRVVTTDAQLGTQTLSSPLDTEARFSWDVIPGKLVVLANGAVPTGTKTVTPEKLTVLGAISSDIIGFTAPSMGSGGAVGGGVVGAVPLGMFSAGFGATYKNSLKYTPVATTTPSTLQPGMEFRFRGALEGALARRTFLRVAAIVAQSGRDKKSGLVVGGVGTRIIGYLSVNQAFGKASVTAYGFDVYRGNPQLESTATGPTVMPKGNLLAAGARLDYLLGARTTVSPRLEFRNSAAADPVTGAMGRLGSSFRFGVDARQQIRRGMAGVLQVGGVTGSVAQSGSSYSFSGLRAALSIEYAP